MKIEYKKGDDTLVRFLAKPPSIEDEAEYKKLMIMEEILRLMREQGIDRNELARRMEVSRSCITSLMSASNHFTIETLVRAGRALGAELQLSFTPSPKP